MKKACAGNAAQAFFFMHPTPVTCVGTFFLFPPPSLTSGTLLNENPKTEKKR
jgi:hypothetical protein